MSERPIQEDDFGSAETDVIQAPVTPGGDADSHRLLEFAQALPKAELHIHVEGSLEPEMVFALAERNGVQLSVASAADLRQRYAFSDLSSFLHLYYECMAVLTTRQDFAELSAAYLRRAVHDGVRHVEMFFDPQAHTSRGIALDIVVDGLLDGFATVAADSTRPAAC